MNIGHTQQGVTLIELMIAMLISLILLGGVIQLFIGSKKSYQISASISRLQDSARYAALILQQDIRMAGYLGCNSRGSKVFNPSQSVASTELLVNTAYDANSASMNKRYTLAGGLQGWEAQDTSDGEYSVMHEDATQDMATSNQWTSSAKSNDGTGPASVYVGTDSLPRSDALRIWQIVGEPARVTAINGANIRLSVNPGIDDGEMLLLTDCSSVDVVRACDISGRSGNINVSTNGCSGVTNDNALITQPGAFAFALVGKTYFVGRRIDNDPQSTATLYLREWRDPTRATAQPLLEDVESLQLLYGEDTDVLDPDGIANRYVSASAVADWSQVVSVRLELLMQSERADLLTNSQTFSFNGKPDVVGNDGRLRYAFVTTISLRNRAQ